MSWFSKNICPLSGLRSFNMIRPSVVLPLPDSPTSPKLSPLESINETSSTARTKPSFFPKNPCAIGKYFLRCLTSRIGFEVLFCILSPSCHCLPVGRQASDRRERPPWNVRRTGQGSNLFNRLLRRFLPVLRSRTYSAGRQALLAMTLV